MRKALLAMLAMAAGLTSALPAFAQTSQAERLKGYFLLSVQDRGKIWYVLPETGERVHVAHAQAAWKLIKDNMIGISNENLNKLPQPGQALGRGNAVLRDRLKGQFLLAVEQKGEVWFVNPHDGFRYYLGTGESTYEHVKKIALGATLADINAIALSHLQLVPANPVVNTPPASAPVVVEAPSAPSVPQPIRINIDEVKANLGSVEFANAQLAWEFVSSLGSAYKQFHRDHGYFPEIKWFANVFGWNQPIYMDASGFTLSNRPDHYWVWSDLSMEFFKFYFDHFQAEIESNGNLLMHFDLPSDIQTAEHGLLEKGTYHWSAMEGLMNNQEFANRGTVVDSGNQSWDPATLDVHAEAARIVAIVRSVREALNKYGAEIHGYPIPVNHAISLGEGSYRQLSQFGGFGEKYGLVYLDNIPNPGPTTKLMYDSRLGGESYAITFTLYGSFRDYKDVLTPGVYEARPEGIVRVGNLQ